MPLLTSTSVAGYKPHTARREIPDSRAPGLHLVIQPSGSKSWAVRLRRPNGKTAKLTLGRVNLTDDESSDPPAQGGTLTLRQARLLATQIDNERANGKDVVAAHKEKRIAAVEAAANTFAVVAREFFVEHKARKWGTRPRRWRDDAATLGLRWKPGSDPATVEPDIIKGSLAAQWGAITEIDKFKIEAAIDDARKHGSAGRARKMYSALSVLFRWLPLKYRVTTNPMIGVKRPVPAASRERVLTRDEIKLIWQACDQIGGVFGPLFKTLLLTGCRLREVSGMTRDELGENGLWQVPASRTKNHLPLVVPLPQQALDIINSVPTIEGSKLVFTTNGTTPVSGFSKAKRTLDAAMVKVTRQSNGDAKVTIKPLWRVHDMRRTLSTVLNESPEDGGLGIAPHVVEAVLNHISGSAKSGVAGVYNRSLLLSEKRVALARWAAHVEALVSSPLVAKVLPLQQRERRQIA
ncbi:tyrosine-type recombinase/integrase [Bradyrhizobium sp. PMVTL-01]|uniref:tyrosine-type recombinase/integrase n=1 Tax=Bradyrhizobium sp. PMVTL-01 TaxID=3434999 RepID=UPI003F6FB09C